MDFTIDKLDLIAAIDKCALVVDAKHTTPSFTMMLVEASKKKTVRLAASGPFASVDTIASYDLKESGTFYVQPARLRDLAHAMPPGRIRFTMDGTRVTCKSLTSKRVMRFESSSVEVRPIEDPGKKADWIKLDSRELIRCLKIVRPASIPDGREDVPAVMLLRQARGIDLFSCNMYLIAHLETPLQAPPGAPLVLPNAVTALLPLMAENDADVKLFSDDRRVYFESCDTLVSGALPAVYAFTATHTMLLDVIQKPEHVGPVLSVSNLAAGVKSVLACAGFAAGDDRSSRGFSLQLKLHDTAKVSLAMAAADSEDEFEVVTTGAHLDVTVISKLMDGALGMLSGVADVQCCMAGSATLVMRVQGLTVGVSALERP